MALPLNVFKTVNVVANTGATISPAAGTQRLVVTSLTSGTMVDAATDSDLTFDATTNTLNTENLVVAGNLTVSGDQTVLNVTQLEVEDINIGIASATPKLNDAQLDGAGITIHGSQEDKTLIWDNSNSRLAFSTDVYAPRFYGDGSNLTNTGATLNSTSGTERLVTTQLTSGTMVNAATDADLTFDAGTNTLNTENIKISGGISTDGSNTGIANYILKAVGDGTWEWSNVPGLFDSSNNILTGFTVQEEGSVVGTAGSITTLDFRGENIVASISPQPGIATITMSDTPTFGSLNVTGITTLGGPVTAGSSEGVSGQYLKHVGTGVTWASFPPLRTTQTNVATDGQTVFNFVYNANFLDVFINGIKLTSTEYTAVNETSITLASPAFVGDLVEFHSYNVFTNYSGGGGGGTATDVSSLTDVTIGTLADNQLLQYNSSSSEWENVSAATVVGAASSFATKLSTATTATAGQTTFNGTYTVGFVDVYFNGSKLSEDQYTATSGTNIALNTGASENDIVEVVGLTANVPGSGGSGGGSSSILYNNVSSFPVVSNSESKFAYADNTGAMYYSNGVSWTSQRLVTTNSTTSSDFATLLGNTQLTYNINALDYTGGTTAENNARKIIRLEDSGGTTDQIVLVAGNGLAISDSGDEIQFDLTANIANSTYTISAGSTSGNANSKLVLTDNAGTTDEITFAGADGLTVEYTDDNTLTFRAPSGGGGGSFTGEDSQDATAQLFANGTHTGINFTYNDSNNSIDAVVTGGGGGGGGTTYDLLGSNTTSNNAILTLRDASNNDDTIEFTGSNGTDISWDSSNKKVTINSVAPVQSDWNASSGLAQILNKPSIPSAYTLPAATTSTLGGVIPDGTTITLDANGNITAAPGGYSLPIASPGTLGGFKVGSGLSIDSNGVLTATGGSSVPQIQDLTGTTSSLADDATAELNITGYKAYSLFKIETDAAAWVRVYTDDTSRDADQTRSEGADPSPGSGVIAEVRTTTAESILITPGIMGFNNDSPRTTTIYLSVTNRSGSASTVTVTLTALQIGE